MKLHHILLLLLSGFLLLILYYLTIDDRDEALTPLEAELFVNKPHRALNPNKLFNLNLNYLLNSDKCSNKTNLLAVLIVTSYFGHVELRSAMRRAFPADVLENMGVIRIFLLGDAPNDKYTSQKAVVDENRRFGDLIQGNFIEAYRNLTFKHLMGLKWASERCDTKFILKMDDDIVIDLRKIVKMLENNRFPSKLLAGYVLKGMKPIREKANKWFVTEDEYNGDVYPQFVSGWFYITNSETSSSLVTLSHFYNYFWIDDLFITGILAQKLRIKHYDIGKYFTVNPEFLECCIRDIQKKLDCDVLVGPNGGDNNLFYKFNEALNYCDENKCNNRSKSLNDTCVAEFKLHLGNGNGIIEKYKL